MHTFSVFCTHFLFCRVLVQTFLRCLSWVGIFLLIGSGEVGIFLLIGSGEVGIFLLIGSGEVGKLLLIGIGDVWVFLLIGSGEVGIFLLNGLGEADWKLVGKSFNVEVIGDDVSKCKN